MTAGPRSVTAIVLAGGRSSRFGRDKLSEWIGRRPLLEHAVVAVAGLAIEVIVVAAPGGSARVLLAERSVPVRVVEDPVAHGGPLVGLATGLAAATAPLAIVVGGDMPSLQPDVLRALVARVGPNAVGAANAEGAALAAVLADPAEPMRSRPLPLAVAVGPARIATDRLFAGGERSLRALVRALGADVLAPSAWLPLDPDGRTLLDVDRPSDLPAPGNPKPPPGG
jgi:molybdopterin-guanine dinucleotide biosynthesis protein A